MLRVRSTAVAVMLGIGGLGAAAFGAAAPASAGAQASAAWHIAKTVQGPNFPLFTAATAASGTSAWAFEAPGGNAKPRAFQLSGRTWKLRSFPGKQDEQILAASASSSSNVWAFTTLNGASSRALHFNGHSWQQVKVFGEMINSGLVLSPTNVWVFGQTLAPSLGAVHYNGHTWTKSARGLAGASALSARSIWAYGTTNVAHWNGSKWRSTSVARLLPKPNELCSPLLAGIVAMSRSNVFAIASAGCPDGGGRITLLHYDGSKWSRIAVGKHVVGGPAGLISDGMGGLWIPLGTGGPVSSVMWHYSRGSLSQVRLPISPQHLVLIAVTIGSHTTAALAVGLSRPSPTPSFTTAVILRYGS